MDALTKKRFIEYWRTRLVIIVEDHKLSKINGETTCENCFICDTYCEGPNLICLHYSKGYTATKWVCQECCLEAGWVW